MADSRKKLQVFVSSTYTDLIKERQAAVEAILTAGHIPAGMELFTAGNESQMEVIKRWIDESDVYLLILGGRYGSIEAASGKSYTQLEYEYALSQKKPLFGCVIKEEAIRLRPQRDAETQNLGKLEAFRQLVLSKMCRFWEDHKDIKIAVSETLANFNWKQNLVGWVRASSQSDLPALTDEMARLSKENAQLRLQINEFGKNEPINGFSFNELKEILEKENLLNFFFDSRKRLGIGVDNGVTILGDPFIEGNRNKLQQLQMRGLINNNNSVYKLSQDGQLFLNKLEVLMMVHEKSKATK